MQAHLAQVEKLNPHINAIVTLLPEQAMESARSADTMLATGMKVGPLHGLPVAHKDLALTRGVRTTFGSLVHKDFVPDRDTLFVERIRNAGAIMIGKTNTPEFGAGSQTFNKVFGATHNPYDLSKTCGGSSGGAAAALASGMVPIADGSDLGGSLRNPASFCNVVGFRPSAGRVPSWPTELGWMTLPVEGPMARTVEDVALLLSVMAGPDPRSPISLDEPGSRFRQQLERDFSEVRIAWSSDFNGILPMDPRVPAAIDAQRGVFESLGCRIEEALPDFNGADRAFRVWRAWMYAHLCGSLLGQHREVMNENLVWNTELGLVVSGSDLSDAESKRTALYHRMRAFMEVYEFLILPVSQVPPFDINQAYVREIEGEKMDNYLDWMKSCCFVTVTGHPSISVPCGFTADGLPVGVQIVGRYHDDFGVLQLAHAFEKATQFWKQRPPVGNS
jgi:amidase